MPEELEKLSDKWRPVLSAIFRIYTPVVIGYAGGDKSLMDFMSDPSVNMKGIYWCWYSEGEPLSESIYKLLQSKNGCIVRTDGFDAMMFMLGARLGHISPVEQIINTAEERVRHYDQRYDEFALLYSEKSSLTDSEREIKETLEDANERIVREVNEKLKGASDSPELYQIRGVAFRRLVRYDEAIADYSKAIELDPDYDIAYYNRGIVYNSLKRYDAALADYSAAIGLNPVSASYFYGRGISYYNLGRYNDAISDFTRAISIDPNAAHAYNGRGNAYHKLKRDYKALLDYNKAIELDQSYADAYHNRDLVYKDHSDPKEYG